LRVLLIITDIDVYSMKKMNFQKYNQTQYLMRYVNGSLQLLLVVIMPKKGDLKTSLSLDQWLMLLELVLWLTSQYLFSSLDQSYFFINYNLFLNLLNRIYRRLASSTALHIPSEIAMLLKVRTESHLKCYYLSFQKLLKEEFFLLIGCG
jgi:hypothetical protein